MKSAPGVKLNLQHFGDPIIMKEKDIKRKDIEIKDINVEFDGKTKVIFNTQNSPKHTRKNLNNLTLDSILKSKNFDDERNMLLSPNINNRKMKKLP